MFTFSQLLRALSEYLHMCTPCGADTHAYKETNAQVPQLFVGGCVCVHARVCVPIKLEPCAFVAFMNAVSFLRELALIGR